MKLLLDTNVFIPLEPGCRADLEPTTPHAMELFRTAQQINATVYLHPLQRQEIAQDLDCSRREMRSRDIEKYLELTNPPQPGEDVLAACGNPTPDSNDWIDAQLIAALQRDLVHVLVTEDKRVHKRCARLALAPRCRTIAEALALLLDELPVEPTPPPAVECLKAHQLDDTDPIFTGLRADYPGFDDWLQKCRLGGRTCWVIELPGKPTYAGVAIVKREDREWPDAHDPTLKICTFKIAEDAQGIKLGELLLKTIFDYAFSNDYATLFVEAYPKHAPLLHLLDCFGFQKTREKTTEELELRKLLKPYGDVSSLTAFAYHKKFGPHRVKVDGAGMFVVPIEPRFHEMLFPELQKQMELFAGTASVGNSIRKAYICNSSTTQIEQGSLLLFYRSHDTQEVSAVGVVEEVLRTSDAQKLAAFTRKRTVYTQPDIEAKTIDRTAVGILFRYAPVLRHNLALADLLAAGVFVTPPRSIQRVREEAIPWIQQQMK